MRGTEIASLLGNKALQGYFLATCSYIAGLIPLREVSRRLFEYGSRLIAGVTNSRAELDFLRVASARHLNSAAWDLAKSQLDLLIARSRQIGDEYSLMFGLSWRYIIAFRQDDEATFATFGAELSARARRNRSDQFSRICPLYHGLKALRRGDVETALHLLAEAEGYVRKTQDMLGRIVVGGLLAHCLLIQGQKETALLRAGETLALIDSIRFTTESVGEGVSGVIEVYLSLWEAGSAVERRLLTRPLRGALSAMRRCAQLFPAFVPRALLWHGRHAWNQGAIKLARQLGAASLRRAKRLGMPYDEALARKWIERFATALPGAETGLAREARGIIKLLARSLR
jgi:hypothetical protein